MRTKMAGLRLGFVGVATLLVLACVQAASAANQGSDEDRRACTPDVFKLCGEFIPDATRITICLQQKVRYLSPDCRAVFARPAKR